MQDKVARLRQLLSEAVPAHSTAETTEQVAAKAFRLYEFNSAPTLVLEQTPRARSERNIERIAAWYGWHGEIARALDSECVSTLAELTESAIEVLHRRMKHLEECAQEGYDPPDAPPAR